MVFNALELAHHGDAVYAWTYSQKTMVSKICRKYGVKPTERKQHSGGWLIWLNLDKAHGTDTT